MRSLFHMQTNTGQLLKVGHMKLVSCDRCGAISDLSRYHETPAPNVEKGSYYFNSDDEGFFCCSNCSYEHIFVGYVEG